MTRIYTSRRLAAMHWGYGVTEGKRCGQCGHYQAKTMYCKLFPTEPYRHGCSCQWAVNWTACGRWENRRQE
jgi:Fe-S-cluster containining protein